MTKLGIDEISLVDDPMQEGARVAILKRAQPDSPEDSSAVDDASDDPIETEEIEMTKKTDDAAAGSEAVTKEQLEAVQKERDEVQKRAERAESINKLTNEQRDYFAKLAEDKQDEFLAKSSDGRDQELAEAKEADKIVFKSKSGDVYRQSDDPRLVKMAREREEDRARIEKSEQEASDLKLRKRATEDLPNLPGTVEVRMSILKSIDKLPEDEQKPALEALQARNAEMASAFTTNGRKIEVGEDGASASDQLDAMAKSRAKEKNIDEATAYGEVLDTPEGQDLYKRHVEQTAG
jgi:hypothetical protein